MNVLMYLLKVILCSGILLGYYHLFLRNKRFHHYNRFYLLATLMLSIVLPLIRIPVFADAGVLQQAAYHSVKAVTFQAPAAATVDLPVVTASPSLFTVGSLLWGLYAAGVLYLLVMMVRALRYIRTLSLRYPYEVIEHLKLYQTNEPGTPFSFFRSIYWNEELHFNSARGQQIFRHELFHVQQRHSADAIAAELITVFGWFNPFFFLIKRELKAIHEFLADQYAASGSNRYQYAELLVQQVMESRPTGITHHFFQNQLKRRIAMIMQQHQTTYGYWSRVMVLPVSIFLFFSVSLYAQEPKADRQAATDAELFKTFDQEKRNAMLTTASKSSQEELQQIAADQDSAARMAWQPEQATKHRQETAISRDVRPMPVDRILQKMEGSAVGEPATPITGRKSPAALADTSKKPGTPAAGKVEVNKKRMGEDEVKYAETAKEGGRTMYYTRNDNKAQTDRVSDTVVRRTFHLSYDAGGDSAVSKLQRYFNKNFRYPAELLDNLGEGSVWFSFQLDEQGNLRDYKVYETAPSGNPGDTYGLVIVGYATKTPAKVLTEAEKYALMKGEVLRIAAKTAPVTGTFVPARYFFKATFKAERPKNQLPPAL